MAQLGRAVSKHSVVVGLRLSAPLVLALGFLFLISSWLGHASSNYAKENVIDAAQAPNVVQRALKYDPRVAVLMEEITGAILFAHERKLTGEEAVMLGGEPYTITTRYSYSVEQISHVTQYVYERFQELGLDVNFHTYTVGVNQWRNVVAERQGSRRPDEIFLLTAHVDDFPPGPVAPGADDNASGTTAVLVAADLLRRIDFDCTLRFVLFTGEEQWLLGSSAYVADIAEAGDDVRGALNLDMIAYNSDAEPIVDLHARSTVSGSLEIAETFSQVVAEYDLDLTPHILVDDYLGNFSDNRSFWDYGYPAVLAIEDLDDFSPHWHLISDTVDTLDPQYFTQFVRAGVGTFAHLGCRSMGSLSGTVRSLDPDGLLPAEVTAFALGGIYTTNAGVDGHYTVDLPVYTFSVQASLPGFYPATVTDVIIRADEIVVRDFILEPWPFRSFMPILLKHSDV
jgi:hypothetical protein